MKHTFALLLFMTFALIYSQNNTIKIDNFLITRKYGKDQKVNSDVENDYFIVDISSLREYYDNIDEKYGLKDIAGKEIVPAIYDKIYFLTKNLIALNK